MKVIKKNSDDFVSKLIGHPSQDRSVMGLLGRGKERTRILS
jgi:hypothetical protein